MKPDTYNDAYRRACNALDQKTKPPGSLGQLEKIAAQLSAIQGSLTPDTTKARTVIFAGDHGVVAEGISAYPQEVTRQMLLNFAAGGAAINAICNAHQIELEVINTGVSGEAVDGVLNYKIADGTANFCKFSAMTEPQLQQALTAGDEAINRANEQGVKIVAIGEMGIGNTTSAAAIVSAICKAPSADTVGRGTGLDDAGVLHKQKIVDQSLTLHTRRSSISILQNLGGFEIAAMCGAMLKSVDTPIAIVVDGYIATAAALCATEINPEVHQHLIFAHQSAEPGHLIALSHLNANPLLQLELRLGEGSGAALAIPLIRSAAAILNDMATFESAGVDREINPGVA